MSDYEYYKMIIRQQKIYEHKVNALLEQKKSIDEQVALIPIRIANEIYNELEAEERKNKTCVK